MSRLQPVLSQFPIFMHYWWRLVSHASRCLLPLLTCSFEDAPLKQDKRWNIFIVWMPFHFTYAKVMRDNCKLEWLETKRQKTMTSSSSEFKQTPKQDVTSNTPVVEGNAFSSVFWLHQKLTVPPSAYWGRTMSTSFSTAAGDAADLWHLRSNDPQNQILNLLSWNTLHYGEKVSALLKKFHSRNA